MEGSSRPGRRGKSSSLFAYLGACACVALAVLSIYVLVLEARPHFLSGLDAASRVRALAELEMTPGPSGHSQALVLDACYSATRSLLVRAAPAMTRDRLLSHCAEVSAAITAASPTQSHAWFIGALVAAEQGNVQGLNAGLAQSRATAPNEGWLAAARIELSEAHIDRLTTGGLAIEAQDLAVALAGRPIKRSILGRYVEDLEFRRRVEAVLADLSPDAQSRFITAVRSTLNGARP